MIACRCEAFFAVITDTTAGRILGYAYALSASDAAHHSPLDGPHRMTQVILGKSRVREIRTPGSVRAKAEWLSYSTIP